MIKYLFSENTYTRGLFLLFCAIFACMASLSTRRHLTMQRANNDSIREANRLRKHVKFTFKVVMVENHLDYY